MNGKLSLVGVSLTAALFFIFTLTLGMGSQATAGTSPIGPLDSQFTALAGQAPASMFQLAKKSMGGSSAPDASKTGVSDAGQGSADKGSSGDQATAGADKPARIDKKGTALPIQP